MALGRLTFPVVAILVTGLLSSLLGILVARAAALILVSDEPTVAHGRRLLPARPLEKKAGFATGGDAALARNLFCHRCGSMAPPERRGRAARPDAMGVSAPEASLVATVIPASGSANTRAECPLSAASPGDMEWGAILRPFQGKNPFWVHQGSVLGQAEVTAVLADRVCYRLGEARGEWRWEGLRDHATAVAGKVGESDLAVRPSGPDRYVVSRKWLLQTIGDLGSLLTTAGGYPELREGRWIGFRIRSLPVAAEIGGLGLRPGDLLTAINGRALDSVDAVLGLLAALPGAYHLTVALERDGRSRTFTYEIQ